MKNFSLYFSFIWNLILPLASRNTYLDSRPCFLTNFNLFRNFCCICLWASNLYFLLKSMIKGPQNLLNRNVEICQKKQGLTYRLRHFLQAIIREVFVVNDIIFLWKKKQLLIIMTKLFGQAIFLFICVINSREWKIIGNNFSLSQK